MNTTTTKALALLLLGRVIAFAGPVEDSQHLAVVKYPELGREGSEFHQAFMKLLGEKRVNDPSFFRVDNWPEQLADITKGYLARLKVEAEEKAHREAVEREAMVRAADQAAETKRRADEARAIAEERVAAARRIAEEEAARLAKLAAQDEAEKDRRVFDKLVFGDSPANARRKLAESKLVKEGIATNPDLRYYLPIGHLRFTLAFDFADDQLARVEAWGRVATAEKLDAIAREDWATLRAVAVERFGSPTKTFGFPNTARMQSGFITPSDKWLLGDRTVELSLVRDDSIFIVLLRISDPTRIAAAYAASAARLKAGIRAAAGGL